MRVFGKWLGRVLLALVVLGGLAWMFGPYEPVDVDVSFDESLLDGGAGPYLAGRESRFGDITEGVEKRVIWVGEPEAQTDIAVLYVHGFSATSEELRPVPDRIAERLGANLVFTRLRGHGRPGEEMGKARVKDWMEDTAEALAVARKAGREVIVISTSTGGTLIAEALLQPELASDVKAAVFVSPNFGINDGRAWMLTLPGARWWLPPIVGRERAWEATSEAQGKFWTTRYPVQAVLTLAALAQHARAQDYAQVEVPALFYYSAEDRVVDAGETDAIAAAWGRAAGNAATVVPLPEEADVIGNRHVIAGWIASPGNTDATVAVIEGFLDGLE